MNYKSRDACRSGEKNGCNQREAYSQTRDGVVEPTRQTSPQQRNISTPTLIRFVPT
jgi:hypothetical protein